jgi:hypothetical protein
VYSYLVTCFVLYVTDYTVLFYQKDITCKVQLLKYCCVGLFIQIRSVPFYIVLLLFVACCTRRPWKGASPTQKRYMFWEILRDTFPADALYTGIHQHKMICKNRGVRICHRYTYVTLLQRSLILLYTF